MESGCYQGATKKLLIPQFEKILNVPAEKLILWKVFSAQDFGLYRDFQGFEEDFGPKTGMIGRTNISYIGRMTQALAEYYINRTIVSFQAHSGFTRGS